MTEINYLNGDATRPQAKGVKIIAHVCKDPGGWGMGFVLAVSRRWKEPNRSGRKPMILDKFPAIYRVVTLLIISSIPLLAEAQTSTSEDTGSPSAEFLVYEGTHGPGVGKHIVFLAGDHEYRSEQTLPMLARILAKHHGFKCTVLFSIDRQSGDILPGSSFMPGTEVLRDADLAVIFLRFQNFPADQMQPIVDYLERAGPVVGLRTSTHAFNIPSDSEFEKFDYRFQGESFAGGFGRQVLGETWAGHYGNNHVMSTRLDIVDSQRNHPVLTGVKSPWTRSGGYWTQPTSDSVVLAMTQPLSTMERGSQPAAEKQPCPNAWTRSYSGQEGSEGRVFTTTSGASEDILDDDFRRMLINSCFWAVGIEKQIKSENDISWVGPYHPSTFQMNSNYYLGVKPLDLAGWDTPVMPADKPLKSR